MTRALTSILLLAVLGLTVLMCYSVTAHAATATMSGDPLAELAKSMVDAIMAGRYLATAALAVVLIVALAKRYAPGRFGEFLQGDLGGALATFVTSLSGALATVFLAGDSPSWEMVKTAAGIAFVAAGGYALVKKLLVPYLQSLAATHAWAQPVLAVVMWIFNKPAQLAVPR
jgi:hypothetical protein